MTKKTKNLTKTKRNKPSASTPFFRNRVTQTAIGFFLIFLSLFFFVAFVSFFSSWIEDQSIINEFTNMSAKGSNLLGKAGASLGAFFIYKGFGIGAFIVPYLLFLSGLFCLSKPKLSKIVSSVNRGLVSMVWISVSIEFISKSTAPLSGMIGYELNEYLTLFFGSVGLGFILVFSLIIYTVIRFRITPELVVRKIKSGKMKISKFSVNQKKEKLEELKIELTDENLESRDEDQSHIREPKTEEKDSQKTGESNQKPAIEKQENVVIDIKRITEEENVTENLSKKLVDNFGEFDPTLELSNFKFPTLNLLKQYNESISINPEELEQNKNKIVETLRNYKIGIAQIKATVGPTITLYEIVPEPGVRISKIKNLEDDIALSLSALGIRIIAPIPGKGTIGIEVPNKTSTIVSMHSVIASRKFQESGMELPIALGKTISNETFVIDLAKMPHLLMAGATGQGKSVGLNVILTSLLYRKHPAEVKFILVDPKKVELTLFNKIERHYLAKLPDADEAIITDTTKVIHTLNSLCIEMDNRYGLLKSAMVRNIKEYNRKFKNRTLNPADGHQFLPYIVLVVDEFSDLIMTAGKEVETPIARLAQLARAIGIHLIIATQRPSVNVITGIIKANFPARIAFRVTSKIDSRTILDTSGADQLIGRGDLLYNAGSDINRIQCAFVDTPEVAKITDFIGSQRAYPNAHLLPEYDNDEAETATDLEIENRDALFTDAAEVIVIAQQGSASLLQRKLKLGYNRAGRLIDQLEAANIVGPFEGSKARQVMVSDLQALQELLKSEKNG